MLPIGAKIEFDMLRFNPIFVSMIDAANSVIVEIIEALSKVMNDKLGWKAIIEYTRIGIGINKMNNTAKNTPIAEEEL